MSIYAYLSAIATFIGLSDMFMSNETKLKLDNKMEHFVSLVSVWISGLLSKSKIRYFIVEILWPISILTAIIMAFAFGPENKSGFWESLIGGVTVFFEVALLLPFVIISILSPLLWIYLIKLYTKFLLWFHKGVLAAICLPFALISGLKEFTDIFNM